MESIDHEHARINIDFSPDSLKSLAGLFVELIGNDDINLNLFGGEDPQAGWIESDIGIGDFAFYEEPDGSLPDRGDYVIASITSVGEGELHVAVAHLVHDTLESVQALYKNWNEAHPNRRGSVEVEKQNFLGSLTSPIVIDISEETAQYLGWLFLDYVADTGLNLEILDADDGERETVITSGDEDSRADLAAMGFDPSDQLIASIIGETDRALGIIAYDALVSVQEFFEEWIKKAPSQDLTEEGFIEALVRHNR